MKYRQAERDRAEQDTYFRRVRVSVSPAYTFGTVAVTSAVYTIDSAMAAVNDIPTEMAARCVLSGGFTYVPLESLAEAFRMTLTVSEEGTLYDVTDTALVKYE
jgi:hypothetical protein